jgi:hypothetical protein
MLCATTNPPGRTHGKSFFSYGPVIPIECDRQRSDYAITLSIGGSNNEHIRTRAHTMLA